MQPHDGRVVGGMAPLFLRRESLLVLEHRQSPRIGVFTTGIAHEKWLD